MATFISTWSVANNDTVTLPIAIETTLNITVNWGDGTIVPYNLTVNVEADRPSRTYTVAGTDRVIRTITVTNALPGWSFSVDQTSKDLLVSIEAYGGLSLANTGEQFMDCTRLTSFPGTGPPFLTLPLNCQSMFEGCVVLDCELNTLDTSGVEEMDNMFCNCSNFNGDLSEWDVQNVTNMKEMFRGCENFNRDLSGWNVQNVSNMDAMLGGISGIDVNGAYIVIIPGCLNFTGFNPDGSSSIFSITALNDAGDPVFRSMNGMFAGCSKFNGNLANWNVQHVTDMIDMFFGCEEFTGEGIFRIPGNNEGEDNSVTTMLRMFVLCTHFNGNLANWNVKRVTDMTGMFFGCDEFTGEGIFRIPGNLPGEDNAVKLMGGMFYGCKKFNGNLSDWNVQHVTNMSAMFQGCVEFTGVNINGATPLLRQRMFHIPGNDEDEDIEMIGMFSGCTLFNADLSAWNVQNVPNMSLMFQGCEAFTGEGIFRIPGNLPLEDNFVGSMGRMFQGCKNFNGNLANWNVKRVTNMSFMFEDCEAFTGEGIFRIPGNLPGEDNFVGSMQSMFAGCTHFNGNLSDWNVSKVINMTSMFQGCVAFTGVNITGETPLLRQRMFRIPGSNAVKLMSSMFAGCTIFNGNLANWNVQKVTDMSFMFSTCLDFTGTGTLNGDETTHIFGIPETNAVTDMSFMFSGCTHFNGNLANWNVQKVTDMSFMFFRCDEFTGVDDQGGPRIFGITALNEAGLPIFRSMVNMFNDCTNFNGDISNWNVSNVTNMSGIFNGCTLFKRDVSNWIMTSIQNNASVPSFTNEYITEVNPTFSTGNPAAWNFTAAPEGVNADVLNFILPEINSRKRYYIDRNLRLRLATDKDSIKSRFSQSVITRSYNTSIIKSYL